MAQNYINISQVKELKDLISNLDVIIKDIYNKISSTEIRVSEDGQRPARIRPKQLWYDKQNNQLYFFINNIDGDMLLG